MVQTVDTSHSPTLPWVPLEGAPSVSWAAARLERADLRVTALRIAVLRRLAAQPQRRWTAPELFDELRTVLPISGQSSVARTLVMLNVAGLACREAQPAATPAKWQRWALHTEACNSHLAPTCLTATG